MCLTHMSHEGHLSVLLLLSGQLGEKSGTLVFAIITIKGRIYLKGIKSSLHGILVHTFLTSTVIPRKYLSHDPNFSVVRDFIYLSQKFGLGIYQWHSNTYVNR